VTLVLICFQTNRVVADTAIVATMAGTTAELALLMTRRLMC
jgi:hypothetical protein